MQNHDALDEALAGMPGATRQMVAPTPEAINTASPYYERCPRCNGSGTYRRGNFLGHCFHCKGAGGFMRKTTAEARAISRTRVADRKAALGAELAEAFAAAHPAEAEWMEAAKARGFNFAGAMAEAVAKYGDLTDKQMAAVRNCMLADAERAEGKKVAAVQREAAAPVVGEQPRLVAAFEAAAANGLKRPILRFNGFTVSLAKPGGKNPGALYVKGGDYMGKIVDGKFFAVPSLKDAASVAKAVAEAMVDPVAAALAYGRATGSCSCCGRLLTDPESVAAGIGPVCATKFGF